MKALLFILAICGFYYGMNYYALSPAPVDRWLKTTQFPSMEAAEKFCDTISPLTEANYTYTTNGKKKRIAAKTADDLCPYFKSRALEGTKLSNTRINIDNLQIERIQKFPYNAAIAKVDIKIDANPNRDNKNRYQYTRKETIHFSRNFLGNYTIHSFTGSEDIIPPEDKQIKRRL
ncbi:hypothetical protein [Suttonella ornithocola]|uniref:Uncharacterized protein n=1 Tax=Suttonella ornithocola TaxID=279832 RepID=A0A380MYZ4_9GAMM|nr:hypothetical protein [Suttonella ornithocola]SUO97508.1 Uncharacterised protein [Suttonella ornithocola]